MKLSFDRIKHMDWKQFAVNHGEKIALGFVGLLVVLILFMGTRWKTFQEKQPRELVKKVEEESQLLAAATWPETEQELFTAQYRPDEDTFTPRYDVNEVYDNTYSVVRADAFRYPPGHPMIWPLHRQQEPIEEPTWLPVRELIATAGRFILELPPEGEEALTDGALALNDEPEGPMTEEEARLEALKANSPQRGGGEGGCGEGFPAGDGCGEGFPGGVPSSEEALAGGEMMEGGTGTQINARGVRFVSVRGVFPFREQVEEIMEARNDPRLQNPWKLCELVNFEIQRQEAQPGPNPWKDDDDAWETLDKSIALDLLAETVDYADDVVDYNNSHYVITSPLPARLVGQWSSFFVGHPKIKTLTQKQIEMRRLLDKELARLEEEVKLESETGIGGFAFAQRNRQGLESELLRGEGRTKEQILRNLENALRSSMGAEGDGDFRMPTEVNSMLSSAGEMPEYLLFRYFDYDVEPGQAYRYRVRLRLMNPNHDELPENLVAADVGQGEYRETPWSEPSPPKAMTKDSKFFVTDIRPGRREPTAKIDLYQWLSEVGTTANKVIEVKLGQIIGQPAPEVDEDNPNMEPDEQKMVEVLRPYQSFEPEAMELATRSAVVDVAAPSGSPRNFHQELGVREIEPLSQALVVNEFGELENRNPLAQRQEHKTAKKFLYYEYEPWEYLKEQATAEEQYPEGCGCGELSDLEAYGCGEGMEGGRRGGRPGRVREERGGANPLRRNRRGGGV